MNTAITIAEMIGNQRALTRWYLKKIDKNLVHERMEVNGRLLNSPYWIAGHLVWADQFLCSDPLGLERIESPWIQKFKYSGDGEINNGPDYDEVYNTLKTSVELVQNQIGRLTDKQLAAPYALSELGFKNTKYGLYHLIRHEGVHSGQLSWFYAINGDKSV